MFNQLTIKSGNCIVQCHSQLTLTWHRSSQQCWAFPVFALRQVRAATNNPGDSAAILKTRWKIGIGVCWKFELLDKQQLPGPPRQTSSCPWFPPLSPPDMLETKEKMQFSMRAAVKDTSCIMDGLYVWKKTIDAIFNAGCCKGHQLYNGWLISYVWKTAAMEF